MFELQVKHGQGEILDSRNFDSGHRLIYNKNLSDNPL